ncbi:hypothetical protein RCG23_06480 [Neobacillus sp. PS3-34]|uniref:hypothetical protein n=1 Tax=Neobacillus sp. PS3-34 TaxID=3070678 RepID=UPI0027DEE7E3|nr:hypothetical protein [Neobacillus sp. PS3-34]WML49609.1 hypothetical protein RCG23_06480 [Neobacillus sp. PS3-34]
MVFLFFFMTISMLIYGLLLNGSEKKAVSKSGLMSSLLAKNSSLKKIEGLKGSLLFTVDLLSPFS